jgi:DNA-binding MurR/RpiR family transcriptional regulator
MPLPVGIRARIAVDLPRLAPAQRRLATYLLENVATASDLSITDLADEAGVSVGTVSMLCRRLGLRGYQDLRLALAREAVTADADGDGMLGFEPTARDADPLEHGIRRIFGAGAQALAETVRQLDRAALGAAIDLLESARRVEWVGVGSAGLIAAEGALKLRKIGVDSVAHFDGHQQAMSAALLGEGDALVAVSHSGRTIDVLESVRVGRDGGAHIVAITGIGRSPLVDLADIVLPTVSYDTAFQVEPMASTIAELAIVQLLFLALLERGGTRAQERLERTQKALETRHQKGRFK